MTPEEKPPNDPATNDPATNDPATNDPASDGPASGDPTGAERGRHRRRREIASPGIVRVAEPTEEELAEATERRALSKARRGAVATVLAAGMVGLRDALEGSPNDDPAIVLEVPGDPLKDDEALEVRVGEAPRDTEVIVRPWLAEGGDTGEADDAEAAEGADGGRQAVTGEHPPPT